MHCANPDEDVYSLLGIPARASDSEITRAYRKLAMTWHPDRNGSHEAEERFKRIRSAYETLRDPQRRAEYDRLRRQAGRRSPVAQPPRRPAQPPAPAEAPRARDLTRRITITLAEQLAGCRPKLKVTRTEYCGACHGSGEARVRPETCGRCRGSGRVRKASIAFFIFRSEEAECADCGGSGRIQPRCPACAGSGNGATRVGHLRFDVPPGLRPDAVKRVRGFGRPARPGEAAGDLLVKIALARHPLFEADFPDLRCELPVSAFRLLAGGSIEVPTLTGSVQLALPADAADGSLLRVDGEGLLDAASGRRGTLRVRLRVVRPGPLDAAQRALLDELERSFAARRGDPFADWARRLDEARRQQARSTRRGE